MCVCVCVLVCVSVCDRLTIGNYVDPFCHFGRVVLFVGQDAGYTLFRFGSDVIPYLKKVLGRIPTAHSLRCLILNPHHEKSDSSLLGYTLHPEASNQHPL